VEATGPTTAPNARIYAMAFPAALPDDFPLFWDAAPYTYCDFRPGNGRLGISGGRYGRAGARERDAQYHARLAAAARRWLPELAAVTPSHAWAVDLAVEPDMAPQARDLASRAPGMAVEGLGALGVLPGMLLGRRAGAEIARRLAS
jgi:glycine/D-amino acid oxidase-like deaminating enzyme